MVRKKKFQFSLPTKVVRVCKVCSINIDERHPNTVYCSPCSEYVASRKKVARKLRYGGYKTDPSRLCGAKKRHAKGNPDKQCTLAPTVGEKYCAFHKEKWEKDDYNRERWANRNTELHEIWDEVVVWAVKNQWPGTCSMALTMMGIKYQQRHPLTGHPRAISRMYLTQWYKEFKVAHGWPQAKGRGGAFQLIKWYVRECRGDLDG